MRPADFPELHSAGSMRLRGEHIQEGAYVLVDGRRVAGAVACEEGTLPDCVDDTVIVELDRLPADAGLHLLQVQNPQGLFSNDMPFHVLDAPARATSGNLISSGGTPEVGAETRGTGASLTRRDHRFRHRFISPEADGWARITFTLAQSDVDVQIDDVGLYEGRGCGTP